MALLSVQTAFVLLASLALAFPSTPHEPSGGCFPRNRPLRPAEPYNPHFPYTGAKLDGLPGPGTGNVSVPAPGDHAHEYRKPDASAYRGVCPGLNAAANHGFLARDGVATFNELVAMEQNVYNLAYDISVVLAAGGIGIDGDIDKETLSIGSNATCAGTDGLGLNYHDSFEGDVSLTRNDYYLSKTGDDWSFNGTLFNFMTETMKSTSSKQNPLYDQAGITLYKHLRWEQSKAQNGQFHFGANTLLFYGAASSLYVLMQGQGQPDFPTISAFFGATRNASAPGGYSSSLAAERLPLNWRNRSKAFTLRDLITEIHHAYTTHYKLFGHNEELGNFVVDERQFPANGTVSDLICYLYDSITGRGLSEPSSLAPERVKYITGKINPLFTKEGCAILAI